MRKKKKRAGDLLSGYKLLNEIVSRPVEDVPFTGGDDGLLNIVSHTGMDLKFVEGYDNLRCLDEVKKGSGEEINRDAIEKALELRYGCSKVVKQEEIKCSRCDGGIRILEGDVLVCSKCGSRMSKEFYDEEHGK